MSRRTRATRLPRSVPVGQLRRNLESVQRFRLNVVFGALLVILLGLLGRLGKLQIVDAATFRSEAQDQQTRKVTFRGQRGRLLDIHGRVLATSRPALCVSVDKHVLERGNTDKRRFAEKLALLLDAERETGAIYKRIIDSDPATRHVTIRRQVEDERIASRLLMVKGYRATLDAGLEGLSIQAVEQRTYPNGSYAAHVTGRAPCPGDAKNLGSGLERALDASLQGDDVGLRVRSDARGRCRSSLALDPILSRGQDVRLTLDIVVQHYLEQALDRIQNDWQAEFSLGIVMDPHTGHILALANRPTFDPNTEARTYNHAVQNLLPPGSIFKPLVVAYGLGEGVLDVEERLPLPRRMVFSWRRGRRTVSDLHETCDWDGRGDVVQVIKASSNVGVAQILWRVMGARPDGYLAPEATVEPAFDLLRRLGFYQATGLELMDEKLVSTGPKSHTPTPIHPTVGFAFGQGFSVSPIHMLSAFAALAREDGRVVRPTLIPGRGGGRADLPPVVARREHLEIVRRGLEACVDEGTAHRAFSGFSIPVAGKTGTAEVKHGAITYNLASFAGYAPRDRPRLAVLIMAKVDEQVRYQNDPEGAQPYGGSVAGPAVRAVIEQTLAYLDGEAGASLDEEAGP